MKRTQDCDRMVDDDEMRQCAETRLRNTFGTLAEPMAHLPLPRPRGAACAIFKELHDATQDPLLKTSALRGMGLSKPR